MDCMQMDSDLNLKYLNDWLWAALGDQYTDLANWTALPSNGKGRVLAIFHIKQTVAENHNHHDHQTCKRFGWVAPERFLHDRKPPVNKDFPAFQSSLQPREMLWKVDDTMA